MITRAFARIGFHVGLAVALGAVLGWPAIATVVDAIRGVENPGGGGLISPVTGGGEVRPWRMAGESIRLVVGAGAIALPAGVGLALLLFRTDLPGRRAWLGLLAMASCVPMPLLAAAWLGGFGNVGRSQAIGGGPILVGRFGAAFVHAVAALPLVVWVVGVGLLAVEPELEESASLDLSPWRVAWSVTLRRSLGAIAGAALAVAVLASGDMTVTDLLSIRTYAEEAYLQFGLGRGPGAAAATTLPPLVVLGGLIVLGAGVLLRSDPSRVASGVLSARTWRLGRWRIVAGLGVGLLLGGLVGLPLYSLVWRAGRVGGVAASGLKPHWSPGGLIGTLVKAGSDLLGPNPIRRPLRGPLLATLLWGSIGASGSVVLGWSLAWATRRPGPWRGIVALAVALALATPGPVAGMALVLAYHRVDWVYSSPAIVVLAYVMRTWPYAMLLLWPAVRAIPPAHLEAAEVEGAATIRRVALPMTIGSIGLAWVAAFVLAIGELPAAALVMPPGDASLTTRIWDKLHVGVDSSLAGFVLATLAVFAGLGAIAVRVRGSGWRTR